MNMGDAPSERTCSAEISSQNLLPLLGEGQALILFVWLCSTQGKYGRLAAIV